MGHLMVPYLNIFSWRKMDNYTKPHFQSRSLLALLKSSQMAHIPFGKNSARREAERKEGPFERGLFQPTATKDGYPMIFKISSSKQAALKSFAALLISVLPHRQFIIIANIMQITLRLFKRPVPSGPATFKCLYTK